MDPVTILAALGPLAVDLGKSLIGRFITKDDYRPASINEWMQMRGHELELFKAMNDAGGAAASYPWVEAIVRLQRPLVGGVVLLTWVYTRTAGVPSDAVDNFASAVGFYLFGDRTLFYAKKAGKR